MMNNAKKIITILIIIIGISLIGIGIYLGKNKIKPTTTQNKLTYKLIPLSEIKICKEETNCSIEQNGYYKLEYNTNIKAIDDIVEKINEETNKYLENTKKSNTQKDTCLDTTNSYNYRTMTFTDYHIYSSKKLINITVHRKTNDLCTNKTEKSMVKTYYYDRTTNKLLSQQEVKEKEQIKLQEVEEKIKEDIEYKSNIAALPVEDQKDYQELFFYNEAGELNVYYKYNDIYFNLELQKS